MHYTPLKNQKHVGPWHSDFGSTVYNRRTRQLAVLHVAPYNRRTRQLAVLHVALYNRRTRQLAVLPEGHAGWLCTDP